MHTQILCHVSQSHTCPASCLTVTVPPPPPPPPCHVSQSNKHPLCHVSQLHKHMLCHVSQLHTHTHTLCHVVHFVAFITPSCNLSHKHLIMFFLSHIVLSPSPGSVWVRLTVTDVELKGLYVHVLYADSDWCLKSVQFNLTQFRKLYNHPTRGNSVVVMAGS